MNLDELERVVGEWLQQRYPAGAQWFAADASRDDEPPFEVRVLTAFHILEYNISNGGWAQFLINCLERWRAILDEAQAGYSFLGATAPADAVDKLRDLCAREEAQCSAQRDGGSGLRQELRSAHNSMRRIDEEEDSAWEAVFYSLESNFPRAWIEAHASFFLESVEAFYGRKIARMTTRVEPSETHVVLDSNGSATLTPGDMAFWLRPESGPDAPGREWLVTELASTADWPGWEMHPLADEFVYMLEGVVTLQLREASAVRSVMLQPSGAIVIPKGVWYTLKVNRRPCRMLFITSGEGTTHKAL